MAPSASSPTAARRSASSGATAVLLVLAVLAGAPGFMAALLSNSRAFWLEPAGATRHDPAAAPSGETVQTVRVARVNPRPARLRIDAARPAREPAPETLAAIVPIRPTFETPTLAPASGVPLALLCLPPPSLA